MKHYTTSISPLMISIAHQLCWQCSSIKFQHTKNEAMNHSMSVIFPKAKDYSKRNSLQTGVILTASAQIAGHSELWLHIFAKLDITMDEHLIRHLKKRITKRGIGRINRRLKNTR